MGSVEGVMVSLEVLMEEELFVILEEEVIMEEEIQFVQTLKMEGTMKDKVGHGAGM